MSLVNDTPNIKYTKEHEWVLMGDDGIATVGITDYAQDALGDIVFVELPEAGDTLAKQESFGVVESVKTTSEVYMPIGGEIVAINEDLEGAPEIVNEAPFDGGWLIKINPSDVSELDALMDPAAYSAYLDEEAHS